MLSKENDISGASLKYTIKYCGYSAIQCSLLLVFVPARAAGGTQAQAAEAAQRRDGCWFTG
ncbi:hypothetical protein C4E24_03280 [ANME-1 cluster archaeon AG-394-G21]|nr:hypothetical protein [ANME-1 cluster archaeon AG-394-G21]